MVVDGEALGLHLVSNINYTKQSGESGFSKEPAFPFVHTKITRHTENTLFAFMMSLAFASALVELVFASKVPAWRRAAKRNKAINLTISIALSFLLGIMFGAAGLIAMSAAIISTVLVIPGYALLEVIYDSPRAQECGGNLIKYYVDKWKQVLSDLGKLIYKILRIITFPIWGTRLAINKIRQWSQSFATFRARFSRS